MTKGDRADADGGRTGEETTGSEAFERIMDRVGNDGRFQRRFNYAFNVSNTIFASLIYYNIIMAMNSPTHWCHVPGRENTSMTEDQWKFATLPRELDNRYTISHSPCQMFNISLSPGDIFSNDTSIIDCAYGYEYDHTWFRSTIITDQDWVCDKELYKVNAFVFDRCGEVVGTFVFGQLGDRYDKFGRRIVFNLSLFALISGRMIQILFSSTYWMFAVAAVTGSMLANTAFNAPYIIAMEIEKPENRARVGIMQAISRSIGMCLMPMVFWMVNEWKSFMWITSLPVAISLFFPKYMIESPRWLAFNGKWDLSAKYLNRIATVNGRKPDITGESLKNEMPTRTIEAKYGIGSFFTNRQLARITVLMILCCMCASITYFILILLISQLPGNPFINFFGQSAVEIPSFFIGGYLCNLYGRRLTNVGTFALAAGICVAATFVVLNPDYETIAITLTIMIKFCASINIFSMYLLAAEAFPTCVRQTGISLCMIMSNLLGVFGPYVVLAEKYDSRYPYFILGAMFIVGAVCAAFLPETLHQKLPDTVEEANNFGIDQTFWSLPKKPKQIARDTNDVEQVPLT